MNILPIILQVILGLGILNVWFVRNAKATRYRGGDAANLKEEFSNYGLPEWAFYLVGFMKVGCAIALLAGIWFPALVTPAAGLLALLMLSALGAHLKVKDPAVKSLPAIAMLAMCAAVILLR
ncbi:MAG: DoxX family protein [Verrucomicrobiales bacterium]|nr:DoxX family protein [Verrucomicrobiales bacterium]